MLSRFRKNRASEGDTQMVVHKYDRILLSVVLTLIGLGIVLVYSASIVTADVRFNDSSYYLRRQVIFAGLAMVAMITMLRLHHDILRRLAKPILIGAAVLLVLVLIPGLAAQAKGAARWIAFGPIRIQPSEVLKLAWITFLAAYLSRHQSELDRWKTGWGIPMLVMGGLAALLMKQPDFGSTVICGFLMVMMVWSAGARWLHTGLLVGLGASLIPVAIMLEPYRMKRLLAFMDPDDDPLGVSFHINQSLISFGSGDWFGRGLGASKQKMMYLPEAHTDFIFSILGEELGLIGVATVMLLFVVLVWRGFKIAREASTAFGALLAFGITALLGFQAAINMAVATAMLPTKGLTLPFVSYGGSSLITASAAIGVLLNISLRRPPPAWMHALLPEPEVAQTGRRRRRRVIREAA